MTRRRVRSVPRPVLALVAALGAAAALAPSAVADDTGVWKAFKGKILVSDQPFESGYDSDRAMISAYRKQTRSAIKGADGNWTLNLMVFLKEPAGDKSIFIAYYDKSSPKETVNFSEVSVEPNQKSVQINGSAISKEVGFEAGKTYEIRATRLIAGKEKVFAKATVALK